MNLKQFNPVKILNHWQTINDIVKGKNPPPVSCEIDPSNLCNHDCVWCMYHSFRKEKSEMIPDEIMFNLIRDLGKKRVKSITFTGGGEPLINPAVVEGLYKTREAGMEAGLVTNGGPMTAAICRAIIETCSFLRVSLDSASIDTHNKLHRPKNSDKDNFIQIIKNIKNLISLRKKKQSLTVGIAFLVHPLNYHEIYKASKLARDIGVDYIQIRPVYIPGGALSSRILSETEKLVRKSLELQTTNFKVFTILHRFDEVIHLDRGYTTCLGHSLVGVVGADCNVYVCCQLRGNPNFRFGNLKEKSFWKIWNSREKQKVLRKIDVNKCPPCRYSKYNELLEYLMDKERPHKNFL